MCVSACTGVCILQGGGLCTVSLSKGKGPANNTEEWTLLEPQGVQGVLGKIGGHHPSWPHLISAWFRLKILWGSAVFMTKS